MALPAWRGAVEKGRGAVRQGVQPRGGGRARLLTGPGNERHRYHPPLSSISRTQGQRCPSLPTTALLRFHARADFSQLCFGTHHRMLASGGVGHISSWGRWWVGLQGVRIPWDGGGLHLLFSQLLRVRPSGGAAGSAAGLCSVRPVASAGKTGRREDTCWPDSGVIRGLVPLSCPAGGAGHCPGPQRGLSVQHVCVAPCVWLGLPFTVAASGKPCFLYGGSVLQRLGSWLTREKLHGL